MDFLLEREALARLLRLLLQGNLLTSPRLSSVVRALSAVHACNLSCFCFKTCVVEDASIRNAPFVVGDWYTALLTSLGLLAVVVIHLIVLYAAAVL